MSNENFSTRSIHESEDPEDTKHGDAISPINLSTTFAKEDMSNIEEGYVYSRTNNPTRDRLEQKLASVENGEYGLAYSSGMAAETSLLLSLLSQGDHVVAFDDLYGGTKRLFNQVMNKFGINFTYVDATKPKKVKKNIKDKTKLVWLESPTNPLMKLSDIEEISRIAHEKDVKVVVDNTFASPYFQNPLDLGSDLVIHSLTKYVGGHSDLVGGAIITNNQELHDSLRFNQNAAGAILSPFDSWLAMRGLKTLKPRMEIHQENAKKISEFLENHSKVEEVNYPGLSSHPQHDLAKKQMSGYSGMLSFVLKGGEEDAVRFVENLEVFSLAESLGGVESLAEIPAIMTHGTLTEEELEQIGIKKTLIRLSIGIEETEDLKQDMKNALNLI